jgi:hypothetical protein
VTAARLRDHGRSAQLQAGARHASSNRMTVNTTPATESDISRMLGEVDPLIVERLLETNASAEEIDEALREAEDERGLGELSRAPSSPRVAQVRAVLDDTGLLDDDPDEADR